MRPLHAAVVEVITFETAWRHELDTDMRVAWRMVEIGGLGPVECLFAIGCRGFARVTENRPIGNEAGWDSFSA